MRILVLDVETTGLKAGRDALLEVGAAVFASEVKAMIWAYSTLLPIQVENPAVHINNITQDVMKAGVDLYAWKPAFADVDGPLAPILQLCDSGAVDICAAHNKDFDQGFIDALAENPPLLRNQDRIAIPWFCTEDITYPKQQRSKALRYLAVDHGIPVGSQLHRALADVLLTCELLAQVEDLDVQIVEASKPRALFHALVSYDDRELAKKAGFRWNKTAKRWEKKLPHDTPLEPTGKRTFRIAPVF
jgi:DNA polymerase-3 subunit epsilon